MEIQLTASDAVILSRVKCANKAKFSSIAQSAKQCWKCPHFLHDLQLFYYCQLLLDILLGRPHIMITLLQTASQQSEFEVFITHSDHILVHKWLLNDTLHSQFVRADVRSKASVIKIEDSYDIFFIDTVGQLICLRRYYD